MTRRRLKFEGLEQRRLMVTTACTALPGLGTDFVPYQLGTLTGDHNDFTNCNGFLQGDDSLRYFQFTLAQNATPGDHAVLSIAPELFDSNVAMELLYPRGDRFGRDLNKVGLTPRRDFSGMTQFVVIDFHTPLAYLNAGTYLLRVNDPANVGNSPPFNLKIDAPGNVTSSSPLTLTPRVPSTPSSSNSPSSSLFETIVAAILVEELFSDPAPASTPLTTLDGPPPEVGTPEIVPAPAGQEIEVRGNDIEIDDGDDSPSSFDQTDFGTVPIGSTVTQTFTIHNTGGQDLVLNGDPLVDMTGNESLAFRIIAMPEETVAPNGETKFQVEFTPSSSGEHLAKIRIKTNDNDEPTYHFDIRGNAPAASSISGRVFHDENRNGQEDPGETALAGVTLYLDRNNNGALDESEPEVETGADGTYEFTGLTGGRYAVRQVVPNEMIQSTPSGSIDEDLYYVFRFFKDKNADRIATVSPDGIVNPNLGLTHSDPDGEPVYGLAYDSRDGILYGSKAATNELFEFDLQTGEGTLLGKLPADTGSGLTYNPIDDRLYTFQQGDLIKIDPTTMTTEVVNATGANVSASSVVYNPLDGLIYAHSTTDPRMQIFNAVTGNGPLIAHDPIDFKKSYAAAHNGENFVFAKADETGDFVTYDPVYGTSAVVLTPDFELQNSANGMAFVPAETSGGGWQVILAPGQSVVDRDFSQFASTSTKMREMTSENVSENASVVALDDSPSLQNAVEVTDVNDDAVTSAIDALMIINELSRLQFSSGGGELTERSDQHDYFYDVNGDGFVSAVDALMVINFLSKRDGEGEAIQEPAGVISLMDEPISTLSSLREPGSTSGPTTSDVRAHVLNRSRLGHGDGMTRENDSRVSVNTSVAVLDHQDSDENRETTLESIISDIAVDLANQWH